MMNHCWPSVRQKLTRAPQRVAIGAALVIATTLWASDVSWHQESNHRWRELHVPPGGSPTFTRLDPSETGITFTNKAGLESETSSSLAPCVIQPNRN